MASKVVDLGNGFVTEYDPSCQSMSIDMLWLCQEIREHFAERKPESLELGDIRWYTIQSNLYGHIFVRYGMGGRCPIGNPVGTRQPRKPGKPHPVPAIENWFARKRGKGAHDGHNPSDLTAEQIATYLEPIRGQLIVNLTRWIALVAKYPAIPALREGGPIGSAGPIRHDEFAELCKAAGLPTYIDWQ